MKKVFITCAVLIAAVFTSNAQVFVGGGVGLDFGGGKVKSGSSSQDLPSLFAIEFSPKVGFYLNDDFAVGLEVGFINMTAKQKGNSSDLKVSAIGWGVSAFARHNVLGGEKLSLLLEGSIGVGGAKSKYTYGSSTSEGDPMFTFGIGVLPVLSYSLTDRLNIEVSCDFLRLGFQSVTEKDNDDKSYKETYYNFGFGVNTNGYNFELESIPLLKVGVIFKF